MASNRIWRFLSLTASLALLLALLPMQALAHSADEAYSPAIPLLQFTKRVANGQDQVTGVFAPSLFSFPVVPQPETDFTYVSTAKNTVTQFGLATQYDNVGLLAHNYLAGEDFFGLTVGRPVYLVYGTGRVEAFTVTQVLEYQALDPESPFSEFRDVETGITLSATEMFGRVYTGRYHLTFQTCIKQDSNPSWGRLFVIAEPVVSPSK